MSDKPRQSKPLLAWIFSLEGALAAFGLYSLGSGLVAGELMPLFWGVAILAGLGILLAVRRRDWQKHWEEVDRQSTAPPRRDDSEPPFP